MASFTDLESWSGSSYQDQQSWGEGTPEKSASDTITPALTELATRPLVGTDDIVPILSETPNTAQILSLTAADTTIPAATETRAQVDAGLVSKSGTDTVNLLAADTSGVAVVFNTKSAVDTILVGVNKTANIQDVTGILLYLDPQTWHISTGWVSHDSWASVIPTSVSSGEILLVGLVEVSRVADQKTAVDTITPTDVEVANVLGIGVTPKAGVDSPTPVLTETATVIAVTEVASTETLLLDLYENRSIAGSGTTIGASDTIAPNLIEALEAARTVGTDDTLAPVLTEVGSTPFNQLIPKSASDTITPAVAETFIIDAFGAEYPTASDTITPLANDNATSLFRFVNITSLDTIVVSGIDVVNQILTPVSKGATDSLLTFFATEDGVFIAFLPPAPGELPPGWYSIEEEEKAGIIEPWLTDPSLTTHPQGWFTRAYWAVYDNTARLRVTDASRSAAHSQAWTRYQIVDKRGKADIT